MVAEAKPREAWQAILEGEMAASAGELLAAFSNHLVDPSLVDGQGPFLAGGHSGIAIFYAYLNRAGRGDGHEDRALAYLERALQALAEQRLPASLFSGFLGVGWTVEHLRGRYLDSGEDSGDDLDGALLRFLESPPRAVPRSVGYDVVSGVVGQGVYALARLPRPAARKCLDIILERLEAWSESTREGAAWWTPPELLHTKELKRHPRGYYNLGLAHGVPGVIAFLARLCDEGVATARARPILDGAVAWLLAHKLPKGSSVLFPAYAGPGIDPGTPRYGWCYGDLGVAVALLAAARAVGNSSWEREALETAFVAADCVSSATSVIPNAGLCHGAAGAGHLFNRLFQATGEPRFKETACVWFKHALSMRRAGSDLDGYVATRRSSRDDKLYTVKDRGLLSGAAGIGLALLSAISPIEPEWDAALLVSLPVHGA
jgi:lantibiotic modifying enzyme